HQSKVQKENGESNVVDYTESSGEEEEEKEDDEDYEEREKEEEEENNEPPAKKRKIGKKEQKSVVSNGPKREMQCPKCTKYRSASVGALVCHLRQIHGITPSDAGIIFKCGCGNESASHSHVSRKCTILNFTIIHEKTVGAKCILCESRPSTLYGYGKHLSRMHHFELGQSGFHLVCSCGARINTSVDVASLPHMRTDEGELLCRAYAESNNFVISFFARSHR
ncbi:hypothetical protein PFISCL1PPCAC_21067, partial [Pristionchus fissidentatus]